MKKIKEYFILSNNNVERVNTAVSANIKRGYQPYGFMQVSEVLESGGTSYLMYSQAMVKYEEDSEGAYY